MRSKAHVQRASKLREDLGNLTLEHIAFPNTQLILLQEMPESEKCSECFQGVVAIFSQVCGLVYFKGNTNSIIRFWIQILIKHVAKISFEQ